jgi:hypothetical protein
MAATPFDRVLIGKMLPSIWKVKRDLKEAGIPYEENGRRADFHSLRHTLATNLARQNVAPRVAMQILRHSDIRLTMNTYIDDSLLPTAEAIAKMPSFGSNGQNNNTQRDPQTLDIIGHKKSAVGNPLPEPESSKVVYPEEFWHKETRPDVAEQNCLARIRT